MCALLCTRHTRCAFVLRDVEQKIELTSFFVFYMLYCLFALVVLLNLLIAMLGFTFAKVQDDAVLQWRLLYARNVLRMESLAEVFSKPPFNWWSLHSGEKVQWPAFGATHEAPRTVCRRQVCQ